MTVFGINDGVKSPNSRAKGAVYAQIDFTAPRMIDARHLFGSRSPVHVGSASVQPDLVRSDPVQSCRAAEDRETTPSLGSQRESRTIAPGIIDGTARIRLKGYP